MTIASKTVLLQMRFTRAGAPFVEVTTKPSINTSGISGYVDAARPFFGVGTEITPPVYTSSRYPTRMGAPFKWLTAKAPIDASYGKSDAGYPFFVEFSGASSFPTQIRRPTRMGAPFRDSVAKDSINAEDMLFTDASHPFWVRYTGAPPPFNTARFFLFF